MGRTLYHASPTTNRASTRAEGLLGTRPAGIPTVFGIAGQPAALYLASTRAEAERYVEHVFDRWFPGARAHAAARSYVSRSARLASFDIWSVEVREESLEQDRDWPGQAVWTLADFPPSRIRLTGTKSLFDL